MRAILTYHSLDPSGSPVSLDPTVFRAHVDFLARGRVRVLPLRELPSWTGEDAVAITFDDGFANLATVAAPVLRDCGLPATVFVVADHVGGDNAWGGVAADGVPTLPLMDWDTLGRLAAQGIEIGAHTRRHPDLRTLRGAALEDEVAGCVESIASRLGARPTSFAWPYGWWDGPALVAVRDVYYWRRPGQLEAWGTPRFRRRLWLRAQGRRVRELVQQARGAPTS